MDKKLKQLFDYQKFEKNSRLEKMLREAESQVTALNEDDLSRISAAGSDTQRFRLEKEEQPPAIPVSSAPPVQSGDSPVRKTIK